jgi:hypothetical protein
MTKSSLVDGHQHFEGKRHFHIQGGNEEVCIPRKVCDRLSHHMAAHLEDCSVDNTLCNEKCRILLDTIPCTHTGDIRVDVNIYTYAISYRCVVESFTGRLFTQNNSLFVYRCKDTNKIPSNERYFWQIQDFLIASSYETAGNSLETLIVIQLVRKFSDLYAT